MKTKQFRIQVKSGNVYWVQPHPTAIDVSSSNFAARTPGIVAINRVAYTVRGAFTLCPIKRWDPLALTAYRTDNHKNPSSAARKRIQAEIIEAVTIYSRRYAAEMHHQYAKALRILADDLRSEAAELMSKAAERAENLRADANTYQTLGADALKACGAELDRRARACKVDRPVRSAAVDDLRCYSR